MTALSTADRLADFVCARRPAGLSDMLAHDAKRLLLNQLKAAAEAALQPAGRACLEQVSRDTEPARGAPAAWLWWTGRRSTPERAAAFNQGLLGLLDFGDTHLPSLGQFTATIVPDLLAQAEAGGQSGAELLTALAVGLEVDIACAALAGTDKAWARPPDAAPSPGATAARCSLQQRSRSATAAALAAWQPQAWLGASEPALAALDGLGRTWQLHHIALHCRPLPLPALAPLDAVLAARALAGGRQPQALQLRLSREALRLLQRPGAKADDDAETLRHAMAAAWLLGALTSDELQPACREHAHIRALRECIDIRPEPLSTGPDSCVLDLSFSDGSREQIHIDAFLGAPAQPLSDCQLSELFRNAADDLVLPQRAGEILQALWGLDLAPDVRGLSALLQRAD